MKISNIEIHSVDRCSNRYRTKCVVIEPLDRSDSGPKQKNKPIEEARK